MTVTHKQKEAAPQRLVFRPPRQRKIWVGIAGVAAGTALAVAIGLLVTGGGSEDPAPVIEPGSPPIAQIVDEGYLPYASSVALWDEFRARQAASALPYASSVALWDEFRAGQAASALPYASSVALWDEFRTRQAAAAAALPYASSIALWEEFLAKQGGGGE